MPQRNFAQLLKQGWSQGKSISVGLEIDPLRIPKSFHSSSQKNTILSFYRDLIEHTRDQVLAYKPQSAAYEVLGDDGLEVLRLTIELVHELAPDVPVILDSKRGDIGTTSSKYADSIFDFLDADAVTLNPYLGAEALEPFLKRENKGIIILCKTSNPGSGEFQNLPCGERMLYEHVAHQVATSWNRNNNCGLVVGATYPHELERVRRLAPDLPILVPGIGTQGGDVSATIHAGAGSSSLGLIIHSSRKITYAFENNTNLSLVGESARSELLAMQQQISAALQER